MKRAPHLINASGKKQLAIHQVFEDFYKEFNEILKDYVLEKRFELVKIKSSLKLALIIDFVGAIFF